MNCPRNDYLYGSECLTKCPNKTFEDVKLSICKPCLSPCENCISENLCLSCRTGFFFDTLSNSCLEACPDYYYGNIKNNTCVPCYPSCQTCLDELDISCIKCNYFKNYIKLNDYCVPLQCKPKEYIVVDSKKEISKCQPCDLACSACDGPGNSNCISCEIGYHPSITKEANRLLCRKCEEIDIGLFTDPVNIGKCKGNYMQ